MAGDGGRGLGDPPHLHKATQEHEPLNRRHGATRRDRQTTQGAGTREGEGAAGVSLRLTLRRGKLDPEGKRHAYITRLENLFHDLDTFIASADGVEPTRLRAMDVMVRTINMCYTMIRDVDVEAYEHEFEELKEEDRRLKEAQRGAKKRDRDAPQTDFNPPTRPP